MSKEIAQFEQLVSSTQGMSLHDAVVLFTSDQQLFEHLYTQLITISAKLARKKTEYTEAAVRIDYQDLVQSVLTKSYASTTILSTNILAYLTIAIERELIDVQRVKQNTTVTALQEMHATSPYTEQHHPMLELSLEPDDVIAEVTQATTSLSQQLIICILLRDKLAQHAVYQKSITVKIRDLLNSLRATSDDSDNSFSFRTSSTDTIVPAAYLERYRTRQPGNASIIKHFLTSLSGNGCHVEIQETALKSVLHRALNSVKRNKKLYQFWLELLGLSDEQLHHLLTETSTTKKTASKAPVISDIPAPPIRKKQKTEVYDTNITTERMNPTELVQLIENTMTSDMKKCIMLICFASALKDEKEYSQQLLAQMIVLLPSREGAETHSLLIEKQSPVKLDSTNIPKLTSTTGITGNYATVVSFLNGLSRQGVVLSFDKRSLRSQVKATDRVLKNNIALYNQWRICASELEKSTENSKLSQLSSSTLIAAFVGSR